MRIPFAAIVLLGLPLTAAAQSRATAQTPAPALPPIGLPLAPIGLPLPPLGLPPATTEAPRQVNRAPARPGRGHRRQNTHGRSQASIVYVVADASWAFPLQAEMPGVIMDATPDVAAAPTGSLRLDIEGRGPVQTFVDGAFVGTLDDLGGQIDLEEGTHRIELRADRYEPLKLDAKIVASRVISYAGRLTPERPPRAAAASAPATRDTTAPEQPAPEIPRSTIYFIPGCYLGNVPPEEVPLPAGCDLSRLTIRRP